MKYKGNLPSEIALPPLYALCPQGKKRNVTPETQNICTEEEEQKVPVINKQNVKLPHIFVPARNSLSIPFPFPKPTPRAGNFSNRDASISTLPGKITRRDAILHQGIVQGLARNTDDAMKQKKSSGAKQIIKR